jgi:hypothetical protein
MTINFNNRTIELTKAEVNKAKKYGSNEYIALQNARRENEGYSIVIVTTKRKSSKNSKVTLEDMRRYITFHDDEEQSMMHKFEIVCNAKANGELQNNSFFEIKKWFFEQYPEVA